MSKRNKAVLGMLCGLAALPAMAEDEPTMKTMMAEIKSPDVRMVVNASSHTLDWVNARLTVEGKPRLYCRPPSTPLSVDEQITILSKWVEERPYIQTDGIHAFPRHLLDAMVAKFPC